MPNQSNDPVERKTFVLDQVPMNTKATKTNPRKFLQLTKRRMTPTIRKILPSANRARSKKRENPSRIKKKAKPISPAPIR